MAELLRGTGKLMTDPDPDHAREFFRQKKVPGGSKLMSAVQAVAKFIPDGVYLGSGGFGANRISTILLHEIVRQRRTNIRLAGHTATHDFQILTAGECLSHCDSAYIVGLEARGLSPNARRQVQQGKLELCEWTNGALAWRLRAAAMGVSFIPVRTMLGTDTFKYSAAVEIVCPFTGKKYAALPALYPDVAIIHVHRADITGNAIIEGLTVADVELSQASKHVILSTEQLVSEDQMRNEPDRVSIPGMLVDAVVVAPMGSYPGNMPYRYFSDEQHLAEWLTAEENPDTFRAFIDKHIYGVKDFYEYLNVCGGLSRMPELVRQETIA